MHEHGCWAGIPPAATSHTLAICSQRARDIGQASN